MVDLSRADRDGLIRLVLPQWVGELAQRVRELEDRQPPSKPPGLAGNKLAQERGEQGQLLAQRLATRVGRPAEATMPTSSSVDRARAAPTLRLKYWRSASSTDLPASRYWCPFRNSALRISAPEIGPSCSRCSRAAPSVAAFHGRPCPD